MDFLPTLASIVGGRIPDDRIIDGKDLSGILISSTDKKPSEILFFYYNLGDLCAVRWGKWKYFVKSNNYEEALYNLSEDISEEYNILDKHTQIVKEIKVSIDECRHDLGDDLTGEKGINCRLVGKVDNPKPITAYNPDHPYIISMYDVSDGKCG